MENTKHSTYPVYKHCWDALEAALMAKSRELIKDIAKTLRQDEKVLMTAFREKKKNLYLVEMTDPTEERFQCDALQTTTAVAHRCRKPVMYGERFCPAHRFWTMPDQVTHKPELHHIRGPDGETFYLDTLTQQVYNVHYERIGYKQDDKLCIFHVEGDDM